MKEKKTIVPTQPTFHQRQLKAVFHGLQHETDLNENMLCLILSTKNSKDLPIFLNLYYVLSKQQLSYYKHFLLSPP